MTATPSSPFAITGPACISFSGGRTSGLMLRRIVDAHGGALPADVVAVFANTGQEREETLNFVHNFTAIWGIPVRWVEWSPLATGFVEVDFGSASREGEPFLALIAQKKYLPNWQARFCTEFLKGRAIIAFLTSIGFVKGEYREAIGLRYDEGPRVLRMLERNDKFGRQCVAPLAKARVTVRDVAAFWRAQPFDLGLMPGEGNCDLCFLKGRGLRKELIRRRPESAAWWIEQERVAGGFFNNRDRYAALVAEVRGAPDLFDMSDEHDAECGLICALDELEAIG
jgi:3'-phosphoadenosine 5'-phosphosulfate sulfotransferase (PAPS reductase)/FAD synthetase